MKKGDEFPLGDKTLIVTRFNEDKVEVTCGNDHYILKRDRAVFQGFLK